MNKFGVSDINSRGRVFSEVSPNDRTEFQRDKDRIVHSKPFRRLQYKTQVFTAGLHDMYRTRLTHSIEIAQIARSVARSLGVNEDLCEVLALGHDIGHSPFGHTGQDALNGCLIGFGGFEHNLQALRIVDKLESNYLGFDGLNLMFETREGLVKHCSKTVSDSFSNYDFCFTKGLSHSIETQIVNIVDAVGYNNHDIDDGIRSQILSFESVLELPLFKMTYEDVITQYGLVMGENNSKIRFEVFKRVLSAMIKDIVATTIMNIKVNKIETLEDVRGCGVILASLSDEMFAHHKVTKSFLRESLYYNKKVSTVGDKSKVIIQDLFNLYTGNPSLMPEEYFTSIGSNTGNYLTQNVKERVVCDYIAGMTDRFAILNHREHYALSSDY